MNFHEELVKYGEMMQRLGNWEQKILNTTLLSGVEAPEYMKKEVESTKYKANTQFCKLKNLHARRDG